MIYQGKKGAEQVLANPVSYTHLAFFLPGKELDAWKTCY